MNIYPVKNKLLIQIVNEEPEKKSVLIMPNEKKEILKAEVVAIGEDVTVPVKVGDHILISPYCGQKVPQDHSSKELRIITESEVVVRFASGG